MLLREALARGVRAAPNISARTRGSGGRGEESGRPPGPPPRRRQSSRRMRTSSARARAPPARAPLFCAFCAVRCDASRQTPHARGGERHDTLKSIQLNVVRERGRGEERREAEVGVRVDELLVAFARRVGGGRAGARGRVLLGRRRVAGHVDERRGGGVGGGGRAGGRRGGGGGGGALVERGVGPAAAAAGGRGGGGEREAGRACWPE